MIIVMYNWCVITMTILPSWISLTNLVSLPSHFWTWMSWWPSRLTVVCRVREEFGVSAWKHVLNHSVKIIGLFRSTHCAGTEDDTGSKRKAVCLSIYLAAAVIRRGLVKLLSQAEGDLGVLEGALGLDHQLFPVLADHHRGLGHVAHLPGGEAHPCQEIRSHQITCLGTGSTQNKRWRPTHPGPSCSHQSSRCGLVSRWHRRLRPWWSWESQEESEALGNFSLHPWTLLALINMYTGGWPVIGSGYFPQHVIGLKKPPSPPLFKLGQGSSSTRPPVVFYGHLLLMTWSDITSH